MNSKQSVIFFVVASLGLANAATDKFALQQETNPILSGIMARTNRLTQRDAQHNTECFNYYIPLIDDIAKTYQRNLDSCIQDGLNGRDQAEAATLNKRNNLASNVNSTCEYLSGCSEFVSAAATFECYQRQGSENAKTVYDINVNASQHLDDLQEEFRLIQHKENKCTNNTKRAYEKDSTQAYAEFNQCLLGNINAPTPTTTPSPTATPVPTTPTEKPATTVNAEVTEGATEQYEAPVIPEDPIAPESRRAVKTPIRLNKNIKN